MLVVLHLLLIMDPSSSSKYRKTCLTTKLNIMLTNWEQLQLVGTHSANDHKGCTATCLKEVTPAEKLVAEFNNLKAQCNCYYANDTLIISRNAPASNNTSFRFHRE